MDGTIRRGQATNSRSRPFILRFKLITGRGDELRTGSGPPEPLVSELKLGEAEIKSFLMLPLKLNPQDGLWMIASKTTNAYQTKDISLLKEIATHISIAIEKIRLYEAERNTRIELERQDRDRTDLVNALVHEMNTPLTAIVASSTIEQASAERDADDQQSGEEYRYLDA